MRSIYVPNVYEGEDDDDDIYYQHLLEKIVYLFHKYEQKHLQRNFVLSPLTKYIIFQIVQLFTKEEIKNCWQTCIRIASLFNREKMNAHHLSASDFICLRT